MFKKMISMARTVEEMKDAATPQMNIPKYSYGLSLCFDQETLDKLDLDTSDVEVGDILHTVCFLEVTSVSKQDMGDGEKCRVEVQVTHMGVPENELTEYGDEA